MNKCCNCGHVFDDSEAGVRREWHSEVPGGCYEDFDVCPNCGGDFEKASLCEKCGEAFLESELVGGYCDNCLKGSLDCDTFLEFATTGVRNSDSVDTLEDFVLRVLFEINGHDEILTCSSLAFKAFARKFFEDAVESDKLSLQYLGKSELKGKIQSYLTDCRLWDDFADYLHEKEVKK